MNCKYFNLDIGIERMLKRRVNLILCSKTMSSKQQFQQPMRKRNFTAELFIKIPDYFNQRILGLSRVQHAYRIPGLEGPLYMEKSCLLKGFTRKVESTLPSVYMITSFLTKIPSYCLDGI